MSLQIKVNHNSEWNMPFENHTKDTGTNNNFLIINGLNCPNYKTRMVTVKTQNRRCNHWSLAEATIPKAPVF